MFVFGVILVRIFPRLGWIWRDTLHLSVFIPNVGKCAPELLQIPESFTHCNIKTFILYKLNRSQKEILQNLLNWNWFKLFKIWNNVWQEPKRKRKSFLWITSLNDAGPKMGQNITQVQKYSSGVKYLHSKE